MQDHAGERISGQIRNGPSALRSIGELASSLGLSEEDWIPYGRDIAKIRLEVLRRPRRRAAPARLVLVSAITPTPAGEGKTTTSIGLAQGLARIGRSACLALREPSLGPCMGVKGGATGGGLSQVVPQDRINLHFTGDFHAVTAAHNLLAAMLDNHLYHDNRLGIDPRRILWRRVMDMNDRAMRDCIVGLGGAMHGVPRETGFDITAASEVMAMLCLAEDENDLRARIDRLLVGFTYDGQPVTASRLKAAGAMLVLLRDALHPNLVQTWEGVPALVHGGPFANIAHGCSSVIATRMAMHLADFAVTEAGFGFELGAEKFFDIKCRSAGLDTSAVVLVATVRALKMHGGVKLRELQHANPRAVQAGLANLEKHVENIHCFGEYPVVAINRFESDTEEELAVIARCCEQLQVPYCAADHFARGGAGAEQLARLVVQQTERVQTPYRPLYDLEQTIEEKIQAVAGKMYGARGIVFTPAAKRDLRDIRRLGYEHLPVCIAKTQNSLSDNPDLGGRPTDFEVTVRNIQICSGAGFLVVLTGDIMRMPGLPAEPLAEMLDLEDGVVVGLR